MKQHVGMSGHYKLRAHKVLTRDEDGNPLELSAPTIETPWFDNLITDAGLNLLGSLASYEDDNLLYCRIGTGNTAPTNSDVNLQAQVGYTNSEGSGAEIGVSLDGTYVYRRVSRRFAENTVAGVNLSEIGMGRGNTGSLFSRALISDSGGSPITIALASDEILDVLYELRAYLPAQDQVFTPTIDGSANTVTQRYSTKTEQLAAFATRLGYPFYMVSPVTTWSLYGHTTESNTLPSATDGMNSPSAGPTQCNSIAYSTYVSGTYTRTATLTYSITNANYTTGIGTVYVGSAYGADGRETCAWPAIAYTFATKLNKTNIRKATVAVSISWGRHTP